MNPDLLKSLALTMMMFIITKPEAIAQLAFTADVREYHPELAAKEITAEFPFINIGSTPITIKEIKPSCGCTVAASDKIIYKPGEKGIIKAVYTIHTSTGYQEKQLAVTTVQDPTSVKILTIKAYIPSIVSFTPTVLRWSVGDVPESKTVNIRVVYNKAVEIPGIEWSTDRMTAELHTIKEGDSYTVSVTPLSTSDPVSGVLMVKLLLPPENTPKLAFVPFSIAQPNR